MNAVAAPRGRNLQAGTAILNSRCFTVRTFPYALVISAIFLSACGSSAIENANSASSSNSNANLNGGWKKVENANAANNAASNQNVNSTAKGTPTPGIPDPANINKPFKPGATPTPGIPDSANIRKQLQNPAANVNSAANSNSGPPMMSRKKIPAPVGRRQQD